MNIKLKKSIFILFAVIIFLILFGNNSKVSAKDLILRSYYANQGTSITIQSGNHPNGFKYDNCLYSAASTKKGIKNHGWKYDSKTGKVTISSTASKAKENTSYYVITYNGVTENDWAEIKVVPKYVLKVNNSTSPTIRAGDTANIAVYLGVKSVTVASLKNPWNKSTDPHYTTSTLSFTSGNSNIVSVDNNGKITGKYPGSTTITMTRTITDVHNINGTKHTAKSSLTAKITVKVDKARITESTKVTNNKLSKPTDKNPYATNPYIKNNSTKDICISFHGYNGISVSANKDKCESGAVAVYTMAGILGVSPDKSFLKSGTDGSKSFYLTSKDKNGNVIGTNFKLIGYECKKDFTSSYQTFMQTIYNEILVGHPVAVKVKNSSGKVIYIVAYAVKGTASRGTGVLGASDVLVIDTVNGAWSTLNKFTPYTNNGKYTLGTYKTAPQESSLRNYIWPVTYKGAYISSGYGYRICPIHGKEFHYGIDITGGGIEGTAVVASRDGTVDARIESNSGYGYHIILKHSDGTYTLYGHMQKGSLLVKKGATVKQGQQIGSVGSTGNSTGPHLHFEVRDKNSQAKDPLNYVKKP